MLSHSPHELIFIDETGIVSVTFFIISQSRLFVRKNLVLYKTFFPLIHIFFSDLIFLQRDRTLSRQYGYSQKGQRAEVIRTRTNSQRITVISVITHDRYLSIRVLNPGNDSIALFLLTFYVMI